MGLIRLAIHLFTLSVVVVLAMGAVAAAGGSDEADAAAGLIIDTGEAEPIHVVVTFPGEDITALDALQAAELGLVTVEFGGLGAAVCEIADTGCDLGACRQRVCQTGDPDSPFWQYWEQDDTGTWSLSPLGASHATLEDGDIAAWVWTGPTLALPPVTWESLAASAGAPSAVTEREVTGAPTVYKSVDGSAEHDGDAANSLAAAGMIAVVGLVGGWLVIRQRRGEEAT
ncbi:MAG: hypothetical protein M3173_04085 [Chloroflexota bacterium]|nr:hypothetical protein [Chloroflexota bacterium]